MNITLSILEYKDIIQALKDKTNVDLNQHAMTSLRQNLIYLMSSTKYSSPRALIAAIQNDKVFLEQILSCIYCEHISLFRDPALWRIIKESVLDRITEKSILKIWLPEVSKGSDYYSLVILLAKNNLLAKAKIIISDISQSNLELCRQGYINPSIINNSISNVKRLDELDNINKYTHTIGGKTFINKELLKNTFAYRSSMMDITLPYNPNLVIFRNRMIYFNHVKEQKAINKLYNTISGGGYLITGIKENISDFDIEKKFRIFNQEEQIYKRYF